MRRALPVLIASGLLASCGEQVEVRTGGETGGVARLASSEADRVRVCRAANDVFNDPNPTAVRDSRSLSETRVQVVYDSQTPEGAAWTTECGFAGDQVVWRLTDIDAPGVGTAQVPRPAETARYAMEGDTVRLTQQRADGTSAELEWTLTERGGFGVDFRTSTTRTE